MDADTRARALEPFFTTRPRRLGLGLPAARAIVEAHGGRMELRSEPGRGTTVSLWLARAAAKPAGEANLAGRALVRALVVDAEKLIVRWMRRSLTSKGCEVRVANGVLEAREQLREGWPRLVIIDRMLADGDGRTFALELATDHPQLSVVFASSRSQLHRDLDRGLMPLPRGVLVLDKPFSTRRFDELIGAELARIRAAPT
jgi:CheY-like chemotaxis protein